MIRKYHKQDRDNLIQLIELNVPEYFDISEVNLFVKYLDEELEDYFVVEHDEEIVACGGINYSSKKNQAVISWDMVHPKHQGKGIGGQLLKHRLDFIRAQEKYPRIGVRTSQHTVGFYEKYGFETFEIEKDYWAKGFDLYDMKMEL